MLDGGFKRKVSSCDLPGCGLAMGVVTTTGVGLGLGGLETAGGAFGLLWVGEGVAVEVDFEVGAAPPAQPRPPMTRIRIKAQMKFFIPNTLQTATNYLSQFRLPPVST